MSLDDAARALADLYQAAPKGGQVTQIHLFGIQYADDRRGLSCAEIVDRARLPKSYVTEINRERKLARYVSLKI